MSRLAPIILLALCSIAASAQSDRSFTGEISGYGGYAFGLGGHPTVGAAAGTALTRYAFLLADVSYFQMGARTLRKYAEPIGAQSSALYDFNVSTHIRIPLRGPVEPYAIVGGGMLHNTYRVPDATSESATTALRSDDNFGFHTGGGARYYVRENWGIRAEYRLTISNQNFSRTSAGIFYQFD